MPVAPTRKASVDRLKDLLELRTAKPDNLAWLNEALQPPRAPRARGNNNAVAAGGNKAGGIGNDENVDPVVRYEEIQFELPIGAGSFGAVWRCNFRGQTLAVKQCKVGDRKEAEMLLLEISYLQRLRHPRLVSFLGCCDRPPHVLLLVEYMRGGSLHALLFGQKKNKLAFAIKARMARQVSEGLAYLHDLSIVHRDLKTRNIVLDEDLNCKICDFGLTVTLEKSHLTVLSLQGSPRYMAPEQFETKAKITEKVDIWQMGCVMLELFCLALPFANAAGVHQIATELLLRKKPPSLPSDANPYARVLIQACLRIEARQRPEAEQLIDALGGILARSMSHAIA